MTAETQTEDNKPTVANECEDSSEVEANIAADGALMIEPLKALQPLHDSSEPIPKALDDESRTGKMTELLQVHRLQLYSISIFKYLVRLLNTFFCMGRTILLDATLALMK